MVFKFVEIDSLFEENSAAYDEQIIEQGGGQMLGRILRFVQERGAKSGNVSHVTKHVLGPRFCYLNSQCPVLSEMSIGDRVEFELEYGKSNSQIRNKANSIEKKLSIDDTRVRKQKTYHALLHMSGNSFKSVKDIKYVSVFYPCKIVLPYSMIKYFVENTQNENYLDKRYFFIEVDITFTEDSCPVINRIDKAKKIKCFMDHRVGNKSYNTYTTKTVAPGEEAFWKSHYSGDYSDLGGF